MNLRDNGLFKFDYQFPVYNFFFPTRGKRVSDENINDILGRSNFA